MVKKKKFREMSLEELGKQLDELASELAREKGAKATAGRPTNPGRYRNMRRTVALIKTLLNQRGLKN